MTTNIANQAATFNSGYCKTASTIKRTINWNKHRPKISTERPNQYFDYLNDPSFQGVNGLFVLSFENNTQ